MNLEKARRVHQALGVLHDDLMTRLCYSHGTSYPVLSPGYSGYGYAIRDDECIVGFITRISGGTPRPCQPMHLVAIDDLLEFDDTWPPKDQI